MTYGGAQRILIDYLTRLPAWVEPEVVALYPGAMAEFLRERNIPVIEHNFRGKNTWKAVGELRRHFRKTRPHIVHTHLGKADFVGRIAARLARVPVLIGTCHNLDDWKMKPVLNFLDNQTMNLTDEMIAISRATRDFLRERGFKGKHLRISYARVELRDRFASTTITDELRGKLTEELRIPKGAVVTIMIGRMYPQKAHDVALRALAKIADLPQPHVFIMAGDGPLRQEHEELAAQLLPAGNYRFLGNRPDVENLLKISDVYLMPSRWEGAGLALEEAFAAGLPAVISDAPGMSEVAESCGGAISFPVNDVDALAAQWRRVLTDGSLRQSLRGNARENALAKWDIRILRDEYLKCYAEVIRRTGRIKEADLPPELFEYINVQPIL
ncbi:N/A [soil metagenome]